MATIKVYGRIYPCSIPSNSVDLQEERLVISKTSRNSIPRQGTDIGFAFDRIFNRNSTQKEVFDNAAKEIVDKFIEGYNGTIFAYGQTGSGKTYTIEGEELSKDRSPKHGLISQTLSYIFKEFENLQDECATLKVSFLEMYNETAYDLLGPLMYGTKNVRDLPKVLVSQGSGGSCLLHGLSIHDVSSEYEARKLHLNGRSNRAVAWTSSNDRSSRSHAIFTLYLMRQKQDSEVVVRSKLNLVDLAGSESLSHKKGGSMSSTLNNETKNINLSLHYLETVIIALQRIHLQGMKSHSVSREDIRLSAGKRCQSAYIPPLVHRHHLHVESHSSMNALKCPSAMSFNEVRRKGSSFNSAMSPYISYRNSLLTMVLQDSLGGNCNTAMIATLSLEACNINETILTCRFAQRVGRVTNNPVINKAVNEEALIKKLQNKISHLTKELEMFKQNGIVKGYHVPVMSGEQSAVVDIVHNYLDGQIADPVEQGINDPQKIRACLAYLKNLVIQSKGRNDPYSSDERDSGVGTSSLPTSNGEKEPTSPTLTDGSGIYNSAITTMTPSNVITDQTLIQPQNECNTNSSSSSLHFFPSPSSTIDAQDNNSEQLSHQEDSHSSEQQILSSSVKDRNITSSYSRESDHYHLPQCQLKGRPTSSCQSKASDEKSAISRDSCFERLTCSVVEESQKKLILMELELEKERLIHKSKLLSSGLSNQKARIQVMEKHGCPLDEIDNERLAEQQLRRKQALVEQRLSVIVKRIVETKSITINVARSNDKTGNQNTETKNSSPNTSLDEETFKIRRLELQQQSTRQKLLACKERFIPGLLPTVMKPKFPLSPIETITDDKRSASSTPTLSREYSFNEGHTGNNMDKSISKAIKPSSPIPTRNEFKPQKQLSRLPSAGGRRGTITETKRKNTTGKGVVHMSKKSHNPLMKPFIRRVGVSSASNYRQHNMLTTSKQQQFYSPRRQSSLPQLNGNNIKICSKESEGRKKTNTYEHLSNTNDKMIQAQTASPKRTNGPSRTRRPALCSTVLMSKSQSSRPASRRGSRGSCYDFEPNGGFILRTNNKVYRNSSFKNDNLSFTIASSKNGKRPHTLDSVDNNSEEMSNGNETQSTCSSLESGEEFYQGDRGGDSESTNHTSCEGSTEDIAVKHLSPGSGSEEEPWDQNSSCGSHTGNTQRKTQCCSIATNGPHMGTSGEPSSVKVTNEIEIQKKVPQYVLTARKQQLARAKRIREVTHAVEVIQGAFRRYQSRKKG